MQLFQYFEIYPGSVLLATDRLQNDITSTECGICAEPDILDADFQQSTVISVIWNLYIN